MQTGQQNAGPCASCLSLDRHRFTRQLEAALGQSHLQNDHISLSFKSFLGSTKGYECVERERVLPSGEGRACWGFLF